MIELLAGFMLTLMSLLIGYKLGKDQTIVTDDTKKQIKQIFRRVVPDTEIGIIKRPDAQENFYRDNPQAKVEDDLMAKQFDNLNE